MTNSENYIFYIRQWEISCDISTFQRSENVQNKIYDLKIRLEQFTDHTKKAKNIPLSWN